MKKMILIWFLIFSSQVFAFKSAGLGVGSNFSLKSNFKTSDMIYGEWNPHENIGARLMIGFIGGFWAGVALNFPFSIYHTGTGRFDFSGNFSLPFFVNIESGIKTAVIGFSVGATLSFATDKLCKYYLFITPAEFYVLPIVWVLSPNGMFDNRFNSSLMTSMGLKVKI